MAVVPIAARELQIEYTALTTGGYLAGSARLFSLERTCWNLLPQCEGPAKAIIFALACLFELLARRQDGEPVTAEEGERVFSLFDGPIRACLRHLVRGDSEQEPIVLIGRMAEAYEKLRSLP